MNFDQIKKTYSEYLESKGYSRNTISTALTDSFYIWRKGSEDLFWKIIHSNDFESDCKNELLRLLQKNSKSDPQKQVNGYMTHVRRFRNFYLGSKELSMIEKNVPDETKSEKKPINLPTPDVDEVNKYLKLWDSLENYKLQENALDKLFHQLCPANKEISDILIKAATLNDFYSTNIFSIFPVAKHIHSLDIDSRLEKGDASLVMDIQTVEISGKIKNFYSFATKYCSHHNALEYPIYDSYVEKVLRYFRDRDHFSEFSTYTLKNYAQFKRILLDFRRFYKLEEFTLKEIDQYIWQLGKEYFPNKY